MKFFVFRCYGWLAIAWVLGSLILAAYAPDLMDWKSAAASVASAISFAFLVQRQKLEETKLSTELFRDFNARYDSMNEQLNFIANQTGGDFTIKEKDTLFNYFNLCGEEYLMYSEGFVHPAVWKSWEAGMLDFRKKSPRIRNLWDAELATGSYYGLRFQWRPTD